MLKLAKFVVLASVFIFSAASLHAQDLGSSNGLFRSPDPAPKKKPAPAKKTVVKKTALNSVSTAKKAPVKNVTKSPVKTTNGTASNAAKSTARTGAASSRANSAAKSAASSGAKILPEKSVIITVGQPKNDEFNEDFERAIEEGNLARDERNYTKAEAAYLRGQKIKTKDSRAVYGLGNLYSDQQRWEEAERAYRTAVQLEPDNTDAHIALSFVLTQPITGTNLSARYGEAEKMARRAIELDPNNALAYDQLGVALELNGIIGNQTQNAYRKAIQLDPEFALAYAHLGRLLRRLGKTDESAVSYRSAVQKSSDVPTMILVADVMQSQQRYLDSEPLLRRALSQDPKNPTALFLLGRALTTRDNFAEAETILKKSAEVSPNGFVAYILLGSMYVRQNKFDAAEKSLLKALKVVSFNERKRLAQEFEAVGDGYLRNGKSGDAARAYRQAIELDREKTILTAKLSKAQGS